MIIRLSETLLIAIVPDIFCASIVLPHGTYYKGVCSRLSSTDFGMLRVSTNFTESLIYKSSASLMTLSGIFTFPVVANLLTNPMQPKKPCFHDPPKES